MSDQRCEAHPPAHTLSDGNHNDDIIILHTWYSGMHREQCNNSSSVSVHTGCSSSKYQVNIIIPVNSSSSSSSSSSSGSSSIK